MGLYACVYLCMCVCVGMVMLLSANSSSAACPAPYKEQTLCLLKERRTDFIYFFPENWFCFPKKGINLWHNWQCDCRQFWQWVELFLFPCRLSLNYHSYVIKPRYQYLNFQKQGKTLCQKQHILSLVIPKEIRNTWRTCQICSAVVIRVYGE